MIYMLMLKNNSRGLIFLISTFILLASLLIVIAGKAGAPDNSPQTGYPPEGNGAETADTQKPVLSGRSVAAAPSASTAIPPHMKDVIVDEEQKIITKNGKVYPLRIYKPLSLPNDTYANQWWVAPTGMESAWSVGGGPNQIKTAVIDTGFALNHQEFAGRWALNDSESGTTTQESASKKNCTDSGLPLNRSCNNIDDNFDGIVDNESGTTTRQNPSWLNCSDQAKPLDKSCNRRDDDNNGYVDDVRGWDFINSDHSVQAGETNPDGEGTTHGTMTAGILGATGNNAAGIAGVNWHTGILPLQALNDDEYGNSFTVGQSVYYAADAGADIISISLGTNADDPYMREAILYALERDIIVVAASGNDGCNCISYPANYPEVIAVGASTPSNQVAAFSSYGNELDITAPGQSMITPYWTKNNGVSSYAGDVAGTSFSTPFIAGLLGLMRSYQPDASWDELAGILFENSDRRNLSAGSPRSSSFGFGFVRSDLALNRVSQPFQPAIVYRFAGTILGSERLKACGDGVLPGSFVYELSRNGAVNYTIDQYERRKAANSGWSSKQLFGACVGLPTDAPGTLRTLNLAQEILNMQLKQ